MTQAYTHFPPELNRHLLKELDRRYWSIFLIIFAFYFSIVFYLTSIPYVPDVNRNLQYLNKLYKVQEVTTEIQVTDLAALKEQKKVQQAKQEEAEKIEKVEEKRAERAKVTAEERKAQRAEKSKARAEKAANMKQKVSQMNVFSAAGSRSGGGGIGTGGSGKGGGGRKFGGIVGSNRGIAGGGAALGGGKKFVSGGTVADESADIEIVEGGDVADVTGGELGGGLEMEEIQEVKGEGAKSDLRSTGTLNSIFKAQQGRITRCFERFKKRDPQLNGRVVVGFTILPDGSVTRISIKSQWSNVTLGSQVDECIRERVEKWKFDAIDKGDVKIELPMSFY